jgi:hypothetical protein
LRLRTASLTLPIKGGAGWEINEAIATDLDKLISAD